eukprot:TRINITY_DN1771_c0_g4_i6.p1 TRINITY_DN1771_c0_g4~~TRINITY_DN1771_c0_g4_i6.p1  ORF type:complete len:443 (-),score=33.70 TRINITY_DN1771_c0_g4_i6:264-1592(-)
MRVDCIYFLILKNSILFFLSNILGGQKNLYIFSQDNIQNTTIQYLLVSKIFPKETTGIPLIQRDFVRILIFFFNKKCQNMYCQIPQRSLSSKQEYSSLCKANYRKATRNRSFRLCCRCYVPFIPKQGNDMLDTLEDYVPHELTSGIQRPVVQWYPGHIARAERLLQEQLKLVDVVLDVRDARIPIATCHPQLRKWTQNKERILVLNRMDMISEQDRKSWSAYFDHSGENYFWTNGKEGAGMFAVTRALVGQGKIVNAKRKKRGLNDRAVRACVVGFPNIGKSAIINRIQRRRAVESAARSGVTRSLRWVRVGGEIDLLDSPGIIPMAMSDQKAAEKLAMCNDIGEAAYVSSLAAVSLINTLVKLPSGAKHKRNLKDRYEISLEQVGGSEHFVQAVADKLFGGDAEKAGVRILKDFRTLKLGKIALELPYLERRRNFKKFDRH